MLHKKPDATHRAFFVFRKPTKPDNAIQLEQPTKCDNTRIDNFSVLSTSRTPNHNF